MIYECLGPQPIYPTRGAIFTKAQSTKVNRPLKSDIEAMDQPSILYMLYGMVSAQQTNFFALDGQTFSK